jgi:hypothetical protein
MQTTLLSSYQIPRFTHRVCSKVGNPKLLANSAPVPVMFASLGKPFIMNPILAMILIGNSPNDINLYIFIM